MSFAICFAVGFLVTSAIRKRAPCTPGPNLIVSLRPLASSRGGALSHGDQESGRRTRAPVAADLLSIDGERELKLAARAHHRDLELREVAAALLAWRWRGTNMNVLHDDLPTEYQRQNQDLSVIQKNSKRTK